MQETMHWVRNAVNNAIGLNVGNIAMVTKRRKARSGYQIREARTKTQSPKSTCSGFGMEFNIVWTPLSSYSRTNQNLHWLSTIWKSSLKYLVLPFFTSHCNTVRILCGPSDTSSNTSTSMLSCGPRTPQLGENRNPESSISPSACCGESGSQCY